jgi:hypothetical protein
MAVTLMACYGAPPYDYDCLGNDNDSDGFWTEASADCGDVIDCNDFDSSINPNAFDKPGDGIDQDCDGVDSGGGGSGGGGAGGGGSGGGGAGGGGNGGGGGSGGSGGSSGAGGAGGA